jgi:CRISPR/Cas system CMR subunit Cmr6 (Cas7 group RAMP superfamily)
MSTVCKELDEMYVRARKDKEIALSLKELNDQYKLLKAKLSSCERRSDQKQQVVFQVENFVKTMGLEIKIGNLLLAHIMSTLFIDVSVLLHILQDRTRCILSSSMLIGLITTESLWFRYM